MLIEGPNGEEIEFPDDMPMDAVNAALRKTFANGAPTPPAPREPMPNYGGMPTPEQLAEAGQGSVVDFADRAGNSALMNYGDEIAATLGGLTNLLTAGKYGKDRSTILKEFRDRQKEYETREPEHAAVATTTGAIGGALAIPGQIGARLLGAAPTLGRAMGAGLVSSAVPAAIDATGKLEGNDTWGKYTEDALEAGAVAGGLGAGIGGVGNVVGKLAGPWVNARIQALSDRGVRLTPGELVGGTVKRAEDSLASVPIVGDMVRARAREGVESLNRADYQNTLEPLGRRYQNYFRRRAPRVGNESIEELQDILEHRYQTVVPKMSAAIDPDLVTETRAIANRMPASVRPEFVDAVERYVDSVLDPATNTIPGRQLQQSLRSLREAGRRFRTSTAHPWHADLGQGLDDLRTALEGSATRHSPRNVVTAFRNINNAYGRHVITSDAASRVTSSEGVFSPVNLHGAVRAADRSARKNNMARGRARKQEYSGVARDVMTPKGGGSPTAERAAFFALLANPALAMKAAVSAVPAATAYSRLGNRAFQAAATYSPNTRAALRRAVQRASGMVTPALTEGAMGDFE